LKKKRNLEKNLLKTELNKAMKNAENRQDLERQNQAYMD